MGGCVSSLPISLMVIVGIHVIYLIVIIKSEVWPVCHCLGLVMKQWYAVYFYILIHRYLSILTANNTHARYKIKVPTHEEPILRMQNPDPVWFKIFCIKMKQHTSISLLCRLWCVQTCGYIMAWKSYLFVCTLYYPIVTTMQTCLKHFT